MHLCHEDPLLLSFSSQAYNTCILKEIRSGIYFFPQVPDKQQMLSSCSLIDLLGILQRLFWWKCSESSRWATSLLYRKRTGGLWARLSALSTRKPGKCQVFLKRMRNYISDLLFPPPSAFIVSLWCLSLPDNISTFRVKSTVWTSPLRVCLDAFFLFISLTILFFKLSFSDVLSLSFW